MMTMLLRQETLQPRLLWSQVVSGTVKVDSDACHLQPLQHCKLSRLLLLLDLLTELQQLLPDGCASLQQHPQHQKQRQQQRHQQKVGKYLHRVSPRIRGRT